MKYCDKLIFDPRYEGCLGAEEEYWTINPEGTRFKIIAPKLFLGKVPVICDEREIKPELPAQQIEGVTGICSSLTEIEHDLERVRRRLHKLGAVHRFAIDTYPVPRFSFKTRVYPKERYLRVTKGMPREILRGGWITGLHGHYGCRSLEQAIRILNGLRALIPMFVSLSARSSHYQGNTRGYASERIMQYLTIQPRLMSPHIEGPQHLEELAHDGGFSDDAGRCWWAVRINSKGTVEVRIMDMQGSSRHAAELLAVLSTVCHQIRHGARSVNTHATAASIECSIFDAATQPGLRSSYMHEIQGLIDYAHENFLMCERMYLESLFKRLYPFFVKEGCE